MSEAPSKIDYIGKYLLRTIAEKCFTSDFTVEISTDELQFVGEAVGNTVAFADLEDEFVTKVNDTD